MLNLSAHPRVPLTKEPARGHSLWANPHRRSRTSSFARRLPRTSLRPFGPPSVGGSEAWVECVSLPLGEAHGGVGDRQAEGLAGTGGGVLRVLQV